MPKKNKAVVLLSTFHPSADVVPDEKPMMIIDHNRKCGGDTLDQSVRSYHCIPRISRWPAMLFMNMLNIAAYNALVLFLHMHSEYEKKKWTEKK